MSGVSVSNYPLKYFVERMAPWADVQFPAAVSSDSAYWKPTPTDVSTMQQADLTFLNGTWYEKWLKNVSLPSSKLIDTSAGFSDRLIPLTDRTTHSHGLEGEHEHSETAFTTWLDMKLAVAQIRAITGALVARWQKHEAQIQGSSVALESDLMAIDEQIENTVRSAPDRQVVFSPPVYQYFQKRYRINGKSVHWEPDEIPDESMWREFSNLIGDHPTKWMIWEREPLPKITARLKSIRIQSVAFEPCAGTPSQGDFLSIMKTNIEALRSVFGES